jgi:N-acetylglutamate synthase-like GNAT family acetyltransferase
MMMRAVRSSDYTNIISVLNDWWQGRQMTDMLPKLFFDHFQDTSFIVEENDQLIGFLVGFLSQTKSKEAYIHFVGVHPNYRKHGIGRTLYETFFKKVKIHGIEKVRCVTSPVNKSSIAYHMKLGFDMEKGDTNTEGLEVHLNYDGIGQDRVLFVKSL